MITLSAQAGTITSLTLSKATLSAATKLNGSCLNYKLPKGVCVWALPNGGTKMTPVLDHYLPDLVVTIYRNNDENPWIESRILLDKINAQIQEHFLPHVGSGNHSFVDSHEQQVIFKEADVVGNPGLLMLGNRGNLILLNSAAKPMQPYFQSMLDSYLWRGFMPAASVEEAASLALGIAHHVGEGLTDWGGVYPHEGTVMGNDDAKASMVIAQRAADLLSHSVLFGHIFLPLSNVCGQHCKASSIQENSKETLFQMVYPIEQDECAVLGSDASYNSKMLNEDGAYVWIVWRHYEGCPDAEGLLIGVVSK